MDIDKILEVTKKTPVWAMPAGKLAEYTVEQQLMQELQ